MHMWRASALKLHSIEMWKLVKETEKTSISTHSTLIKKGKYH